jgi:hypothetical protein
MLFISLFKSLKKPWIKALLLDCALVNLFVKLDKFENKKFNFIFLNSIAHIQHRYILNSKKINSKIKNPEWLISKKNDPIEESFYFLDYILGKLINNNQFIVMNGFSQIPYDRIKFYWRIKNLNSFFQIVGINFTSIDQKMTRDFEIHFDNIEDLNKAKLILDSAFCNSDNYRIFSDISIKNYSLFASLTYPFEIKKNDLISINNKTLEFSKFTSFVAIKNAMHSSKGTIYLSDAFLEKTNANIFEKTYDISKIKDLILNILGKSKKVV